MKTPSPHLCVPSVTAANYVGTSAGTFKAFKARTQRGAVLLITVMLVLMLTILALGLVALNSTQTRIATNSADVQIAFQTAEAALNQAQSNLLAGNYPAANFQSNNNGLYLFNPANPPLWTTILWSGATTVIPSFQGNSKSAAAFFIELLPSVVLPGQNMKKVTRVYRVTARAVGASGGAPVLLQATVQIQQ
ncbi:PilX N-terminal domain-containing pilus assembly protein [Glaciimonas sp. PAMC28666]|uniref:pilus assembly PilX family protein n=1 Tax=Glaciimonas sp. PAMC28666 TaxID=2807626 RepID=UPI001964069A|nr:PilX N-terminal domain-containing pilus assembly protein [Glaciimonas sp. PAMC28666]QRX84115.1 pilus assembly protein PilX [Glaciimonas sp. PAMC28666]